jgi:transposase InsO family protein
MILEWIAEAVAAGARLERACEVAELDARTVQRWRKQGPQGGRDRREGPRHRPRNALSEQERSKVLAATHRAEFRDASPKTIVPALADRGEYLGSESTFYRVLREAGEATPRGRARPATPRPVATHTATGPNQVWSWDITYLPTRVRGMFFYLYMVVDIWSRQIMGWAVHECERSELAADLIRGACEAAGVRPGTLVIHSDNGAPMRGSTLLATMERLGVMASFSRPSVSDDNAFSEALFRTVKYVPWWPSRPFKDVSSARSWVGSFERWYNGEHLHSGIGFVTPASRHAGSDAAQLEGRRALYERAREAHPERWSGTTRRWERPGEVSLNARHPRRSSAPTQVPTTKTKSSGAPPARRQSPQEAQPSRPRPDTSGTTLPDASTKEGAKTHS